jgi:hypothetical protein
MHKTVPQDIVDQMMSVFVRVVAQVASEKEMLKRKFKLKV